MINSVPVAHDTTLVGSTTAPYPPMSSTAPFTFGALIKANRCVTEPAQLCGEEGPITSRWIEDGPSERMKKMLDTIDKVRTSLGGLKHTKYFYEELLSSLPQFVACGPQSAGKSSVIRRVSGVYLPEASTLCTRMATIIQMRRSSASASSSTTTIVTLTGPNGVKILEDRVDDDGDDDGDGEEGCTSRSTSVRDLVKKAQAKALEMFPFKQFIQDHSVNVYVTGPTLVNVTLVDLPGFHTSDDADTKTVNEMVKRYVEMPGTLVLHVVKGDQDYASLLGNDFMRRAPKHDAGRVTVLTHCDKLDVTSEADISRLQTTLDTTTINSTLTIAVMGNAKDDEYEHTKLNHLTSMDDRLEVGAKALSVHLEDRMREHMNMQFPKAIAKLETSLVDTTLKLESIRERSPVEILCEMVQTIRENFRNEKNTLMNDLRLVLEKMTIDIKNFGLRPTKSTWIVTERDKFDDEFEPGQLVSVDIDDKHVDCYFVKKTGNDKVILKTGSGNKTVTKSISELRSGEIANINCMVEEIEKLACDRGMRNLVHADRQSILEVYANAFAEHYKSILVETLDDISEKLETFYDTVFSLNVNDLAKPVAERLRVQMQEEQKEARNLADQACDAIVLHNTNPDLIFSPNEHYLNSLVQQMVEADTDMASDSGGARHIYHNVRAFIKVQRKYISELASKELIRTTILETGSRFNTLFDSNIGKPGLVNLIQEPSKLARERKILLNRKKVLEEALALAAHAGM